MDEEGSVSRAAAIFRAEDLRKILDALETQKRLILQVIADGLERASAETEDDHDR